MIFNRVFFSGKHKFWTRKTCTYPESFVKAGQTLTTAFFVFFLVYEGGGIQMPI